MPELIPRSTDNPDFARVIEVRTLSALDGFDFDVAPTPAEAAALARLLGAQAVRKVRFSGRLTPLPDGGWALDAALGASVVQTCVVSLEPVTARIDQAVRRRFLPAVGVPSGAPSGASSGARGAELVVEPDEDDEIEPLGERIDLGLVATEALALALPAYPRKEGAELGLGTTLGTDSRGAGPGSSETEEPKPFAALAALRGKMGEGM